MSHNANPQPRPTSSLHRGVRCAPPLFCRFTFAPLVIASDLAGVSTMCDDLVEGLNAKCVEDFANQKIVTPLSETLLTLNQGQGLGVSGFISGNTIASTAAMQLARSVWCFLLTSHTLHCSFKSLG